MSFEGEDDGLDLYEVVGVVGSDNLPMIIARAGKEGWQGALNMWGSVSRSGEAAIGGTHNSKENFFKARAGDL